MKHDFLTQRHRLHTEYSSYFNYVQIFTARNTFCSDVKQELLVKGIYEEDNIFQRRTDNSEFKPISNRIAEGTANELLSGRIVREIPAGILQQWSEAVDGTYSIQEFIDEIAPEVMSWGFVDVLIDKPKGGNYATLAEEISNGGLPYAVKYYPSSRVNWKTDQYGFVWVLYKELDYVSDDPYSPQSVIPRQRYRLVDREKITVYTEMIDASGRANGYSEEIFEHGLKICPIATFASGKEIEGQKFHRSIIWDALKYDLDAYRRGSDLHYAAYLHCNPLLLCKTTEPPKSLQLGSHKAVHLNPKDSETMEYLRLETAQLDTLLAIIDKEKLNAFNELNIDPAGVIQGRLAAESGISRSYRWNSAARRTLTGLSKSFQRSEYEMFEIVNRWMSSDNSFINKPIEGLLIQYPMDFDMNATQTEIENYAASSPYLGHASKTWNVEALKNLAFSLLPDMEEDTKTEIVKEIENYVLTQTEVMDNVIE